MAQRRQLSMLNKSNTICASLAAGCVTLPNLITQSFPATFTQLAPYTQGTLPYCTGVCGACGGTCLGSIGVIAALGIAAKLKRKEIKNVKPVR